MLRMKGPDNIIVHDGIERATLNSKVAQWLQTPVRRRCVAIAFVLAACGFLALFMHVDWSKVYGTGDTGFEVFRPGTVIAFVAMLILILVIEQLLFMAIRPVLSFDDEAYDERQASLVMSANAKARYSGVLFLAALMIAGLAQAPATIIGFLGVLFMMMTFMTPHFVLAWTLPNTLDAVDIDYE